MNKTIKIGNREVGSGRTFVIAEVGSNHCQDLQLAYESIDAAAEAGADAVKFQSIRLDRLYHNPTQATIDLHKQIDLPEEWHALLNDRAAKKGIIFFSSPTYLEAVDILEQVNVPLYKLASAQVGTFPQIIAKVAKTGKPVLLSTGLVTYAELTSAVRIFEESHNSQYVILHCNSVYPAPPHRVHLPIMDAYKAMFDCIVGFSDHTAGISAAVAAVARGASVIEKHFSMKRSLPSPDAALSIEPDELRQMVADVRSAEQMLTPNPRIHLEPEELGFKNVIQTYLVMKHDKKAGEAIGPGDFLFRRSPDRGIDCSELDQIVGRNLKTDMRAGTLLTMSAIQ